MTGPAPDTAAAKVRVMDDSPSTPMFDGGTFLERLDAVEKRLEVHAKQPVPAGLTEPDEGGTERWEAAQVWAHIVEFVPYWQSEIEKVIAEYDGTPVPFGRTKADPARAAAIELGRSEPIPALAERNTSGVADMRAYLAGLTSAEWNAVGLHQRLGEMDVEAIVERFVVGHLEEHADQLDGLE